MNGIIERLGQADFQRYKNEVEEYARGRQRVPLKVRVAQNCGWLFKRGEYTIRAIC